MAYKNYALMRKTNGKTRLVSFMQTLKASTSGFKYFCFQGKPLTSILKVLPTPLDAKVTLVADGFSQIDNSIIVSIGTPIQVKVEKDGYIPYETTIVANDKDYSLDIALDTTSTFKMVVDTTETLARSADNTFIIPFTAGTYTALANEPLTISWGDGSETIIEDGVITQNNCTHTYETPGRYNIIVETYSGKMPSISFDKNYGDINNNKLKLLSVSTSLMNVVDTNGASTKIDNLFKGCKNLSYIPYDLFKYNNQLTHLVSCFEECNGLKHILDQLLMYVPNLQDASNMFKNCDTIKNIPDGLLKANSKLVNCYRMFYDCDELQATPNNLFSACKNVNNYEECFYGCEKLTYNPLLFGSDFTHLGKVENINFANMFYRERFTGTNIGTIPEIWDVVIAPLENTQGCFGEYMHNETVPNYWRIPFEWGGAERIQVDMDIDDGLSAILYNYDLFELPYYKDDGWNRIQVKPTPSDSTVNIVHKFNGNPTDYKQNFLNYGRRGFIQNGWASDFSDVNYLTIGTVQGYGYEIVLQIKTSNNVTLQQNLIGNHSGDNSFSIGIKNSTWALIDKTGSQTEANGSVTGGTVKANTTYYVKIVNTGTALGATTTLSYSTDSGKTYTTACSIAQDKAFKSPLPLGQKFSKDSTWNAFLGTIYLANSYAKVGSTTVWNGKNHAKVGYWVDEGVVSGFTTSYYCLFPEAITNGSNTWEIMFKATTGSALTNNAGLFGYNGGGMIRCDLNSNALRVLLSTSTSSWTIGTLTSQTLAVNTTYWFKITFTGSAYNLYRSTDGKTFNLDSTISSSTVLPLPNDIRIGMAKDGAWNGKIHMKDSYIKVNGKEVWNNKTNEYKYWDNKYTPNHTVVGSQVKVRSGIASGFTTTDYLKSSATIPACSDYEIGLKIKTASSILTTGQSILAIGENANEYNFVYLANAMAGTSIYMKTGDNSSTNNLNNTLISSVPVSTTYYIKLRVTSSKTSVYTSTSGYTNMTLVKELNSGSPITTASTVFFGYAPSNGKGAFGGSIDFNNSYINVNGSTWWNGKSYSQVGFRDVEGTNIGFSKTQYIKSPSAITSAPSSFEFHTHFMTDSALSANQSLLSSNADYKGLGDIEIRSKKINVWISTNGSSNGIASQNVGTYLLEASTYYWLRYRFNGFRYTIEMSMDGKCWNISNYIANTNKVYGTENIWLGLDQTSSGSNPLLGRIYLGDVYFNVNGKRWWDCQSKNRTNYVTPITTKEFLAIPQSKLMLNVFKDGYDDYATYHTFTGDVTISPSLTKSSEI